MRTKNIFIIAILLFITIFVVGQTNVRASSANNVFGTAVSSDIGTISFNNCTASDSCSGSIDYGVSIDSSGNWSGYGWSDNIGWVKFDGVKGPALGTNGRVTGDAQVCAVYESGCSGNYKGGALDSLYLGGWDGKIKLNPSVSDYVSITDSKVTGHAWGSDVVGWVDFNLTINNDIPITVELKINGKDSASIEDGPFKLTWTSTGATKCESTTNNFNTNNDTNNIDGVSPTSVAVGSYIISCTNGVNSLTDNVTIYDPRVCTDPNGCGPGPGPTCKSNEISINGVCLPEICKDKPTDPSCTSAHIKVIEH